MPKFVEFDVSQKGLLYIDINKILYIEKYEKYEFEQEGEFIRFTQLTFTNKSSLVVKENIESVMSKIQVSDKLKINISLF